VREVTGGENGQGRAMYLRKGYECCVLLLSSAAGGTTVAEKINFLEVLAAIIVSGGVVTPLPAGLMIGWLVWWLLRLAHLWEYPLLANDGYD
jgi:hypothetical protein